MAGNGRKQDGTFAVGNPGGPGRPSRVVESTYLVVMSDRVTLDDWAAIVGKAVEQAKAGDATARAWLGSHLLPPCPSSALSHPLRGARTCDMSFMDANRAEERGEFLPSYAGGS